MKRLVLAASVSLLGCTLAFSQAPYRIYTSPKLPARDALARMNLVMAWNARLQIDSRRDGIASVQVIPGAGGAQVIAQTIAGLVYAFDADTGDLLWKRQIGVPYWSAQGVGYNSRSIFVTRRNMLHVLNRATGRQLLFTFDPATKENLYGYSMNYAPSAAPVADEKYLHLSMGDWIEVFEIPDFERAERLKLASAQGQKDAIKELKSIYKDEEPTQDSPQPEQYWGHRIFPETTEFSPLISGGFLCYLTTSGNFGRVNRFDTGLRVERAPFKMRGRALGAAGQYKEFAYVGSDDANLYAFNMETGGLAWRYVSGAPILQQPVVNDRDVYIVPERVGLRLVDRASGREVWTNRDASRFLAANDKFVYAMDRFGKFFVLDGQRGSTLARYDITDWAIPVANEWTDRVYLAANDGQIMCLRNRDLTTALVMKTPEVVQKFEPKKAPAPKKEEMKDDDKKDPEKKDAEKKDAEKKDAEKKDAEKMGRLPAQEWRLYAFANCPALAERRLGAER